MPIKTISLPDQNDGLEHYDKHYYCNVAVFLFSAKQLWLNAFVSAFYKPDLAPAGRAEKYFFVLPLTIIPK
jgi:hypothetical protein